MTGYRVIEIHESTADAAEAGRISAVPVSTAWDQDAPSLPGTWSFAAPWRTAVEQRRSMLSNDLTRLGVLTMTQVSERTALRVLLKDAQDAATAKVGLAKWWWGTEVERAWVRLHEVEERSIDLIPVDELETRAAVVSGYGAQRLKSDDKLLLALDALRADVATAKKKPDALRPVIVDVLRAVHAQSDRDNRAARHLRNRLLILSGTWVLLGFTALAMQRILSTHPFLVTNDLVGGHPSAYLFLVLTFGALGAVVTAMPTLSQIPSDFSPFNLPLQQAVLKLTFGPIAAFLGFLIVDVSAATNAFNTDAVNIAVPDTLPGVLLLAVVFGAAQHLVTRYVDRRAEEILEAIAPEAKD